MNTKDGRAYSTEDVAMVAENHQYGAEVYEAYQKSKDAENLVGQAESCIASYSKKTR